MKMKNWHVVFNRAEPPNQYLTLGSHQVPGIDGTMLECAICHALLKLQAFFIFIFASGKNISPG